MIPSLITLLHITWSNFLQLYDVFIVIFQRAVCSYDHISGHVHEFVLVFQDFHSGTFTAKGQTLMMNE